jgi:tRNA (guanine-N7-)-methyltransferase
MAQKKLLRFKALNSFSNVFQYPQGMQGKWNEFFKNENPIVLELACGKGEYAIGLAKMYPHKNYIGVDLKGNRIYIGAKKCLEENITNVAFLRTHIDKLPDYFNKDEVQEIWLTFPDPQLRKSRSKKRLTHPRFLRLYNQVLIDRGAIHLKTDSPILFAFTRMVIDMYSLDLIESDDDVYAKSRIKDELEIRTYYESLDIAGSKRVHYLKFSLPAHELPQIDADLHKKIMENETAI